MQHPEYTQDAASADLIWTELATPDSGQLAEPLLFLRLVDKLSDSSVRTFFFDCCPYKDGDPMAHCTTQHREESLKLVKELNNPWPGKVRKNRAFLEKR